MDILFVFLLSIIFITRSGTLMKVLGDIFLITSILLLLSRYFPQVFFEGTMPYMCIVLIGLFLLFFPNKTLRVIGIFITAGVLVLVIGFLLLFISCIALVGGIGYL